MRGTAQPESEELLTRADVGARTVSTCGGKPICKSTRCQAKEAGGERDGEWGQNELEMGGGAENKEMKPI